MDHQYRCAGYADLKLEMHAGSHAAENVDSKDIYIQFLLIALAHLNGKKVSHARRYFEKPGLKIRMSRYSHVYSSRICAKVSFLSKVLVGYSARSG